MDSTQRKELKLNFFSCSNDFKEEEVIIVILLSQDDTAEDVLPKFGTPETKLTVVYLMMRMNRKSHSSDRPQNLHEVELLKPYVSRRCSSMILA